MNINEYYCNNITKTSLFTVILIIDILGVTTRVNTLNIQIGEK